MQWWERWPGSFCCRSPVLSEDDLSLSQKVFPNSHKDVRSDREVGKNDTAFVWVLAGHGVLDKRGPEVRWRACCLENQKLILSLATTLGPLALWGPVS